MNTWYILESSDFYFSLIAIHLNPWKWNVIQQIKKETWPQPFHYFNLVTTHSNTRPLDFYVVDFVCPIFIYFFPSKNVDSINISYLMGQLTLETNTMIRIATDLSIGTMCDAFVLRRILMDCSTCTWGFFKPNDMTGVLKIILVCAHVIKSVTTLGKNLYLAFSEFVQYLMLLCNVWENRFPDVYPTKKTWIKTSLTILIS